MIQSVNNTKLNKKHRLFALLWAIFAICFVTADLDAKVEAKNYDFSLEQFRLFQPGAKKSDISNTYKAETLIFKEGQFETYRYYVEQIRYKFPVFVQFHNGVVTDFYAKLPSYFLHDLFHQSLINKIGPQDKYKKVEEQAIYIWTNKDNSQHVYFASCTITCFPVYYAVIGINTNNGFESLMQKFESKAPKN